MSSILQCHPIDRINFVHGENCYLYDDTGKKYVDFIAGCWSTALGHHHPQLNHVMTSQIDRLIHLGWRYPSQVVENAASEIVSLLGFEGGKCVFLSSGSEAVELGIKMARHLMDASKLLTFTTSYLSAFGTKRHDEWKHLDWSLFADGALGDVRHAVSTADIGGFVFEPGGSGSEAVRFPPKFLVQDIASLMKENGGWVIANEITTGFGRLGTWFGFHHYGIQPDIVAMGKCLGNGYPVSAVAVTKDVADQLESSNFHHVQSHQNDPLGCAVAREVIAILKEEQWIERGKVIGVYFLNGLKRIKEKHAMVKDVRGKGMLFAFELFPKSALSIEMLYRELFTQGFLVLCSVERNLLRFDPPLTIGQSDIDDFLECLDYILQKFDM